MSNRERLEKGWEELTERFQKLLSVSSRLQNHSGEETSSETFSSHAHAMLPLSLDVSSQQVDLGPSTQKTLTQESSLDELTDLDTSKDLSNSEEDLSSSLSSDWQFLLEADLGEEEEEQTPETKMSTMLHQGSVMDIIDLDELASTSGEVEDLVKTAENLLLTFDTNSPSQEHELYRAIHTLKGTLGITGEARARTLIHHLETTLDEIKDGLFTRLSKKQEVTLFFEKAKVLMDEVRTGNWSGAVHTNNAGVPLEQPSIMLPKFVNVDVIAIDKMIGDINEGRLDNIALEEFFVSSRNKLKELEENAQRAFRMLRELELQAEIQIQSRKSQLQEVGEDFDPLEFDRFTKLQELSRITSESLIDILEVRREMMKASVDQEALLAHQKRSIISAQDRLHKTRLVQADAINDRLYKLVRTVAKEEGKSIAFEMIGGRVELDRVLLDKITPALEHVIRNSIVHGVEKAQVRHELGKPSTSTITLSVQQEAARAFIEIHDDGYGLRTESIRQKAIEKSMWPKDKPMTDAQAAEMICTSGFSTASQPF